MQRKFETAMKTPPFRASKQVPTWYACRIILKSPYGTILEGIWIGLATNKAILWWRSWLIKWELVLKLSGRARSHGIIQLCAFPPYSAVRKMCGIFLRMSCASQWPLIWVEQTLWGERWGGSSTKLTITNTTTLFWSRGKDTKKKCGLTLNLAKERPWKGLQNEPPHDMAGLKILMALA